MILKGELSYLSARFGMSENSVGLDTGVLWMLIVSCIVICPLSSMEDVSRLKTLSPLGCIAAIFIMVTVLLCAPWDSLEPCTGPSSTAGTLIDGAGSLKWVPESLMGVA